MASPRAASTVTPVKKKRIHSRNGQTGIAGAGLKSPGRYQLPNRCARTAAFPYQPSSVYLAQSEIHGEWLGKSARRLSACNTAKPPAATSQTAYSQRLDVLVNGRLRAINISSSEFVADTYPA